MRAVLVALLLSGCASVPADEPLAATAPPGEDRLALSGCEGAFTIVRGPTALHPPNAPPGWEADPAAVTAVQVMLLLCERLSWGPFERGPVSIAQEWRDDFQAPPSCNVASHEFRFILESVWFSDPDVAAYAKSLGMPAASASFAVQAEPLAQATRHEWTWGPSGQAPSTLTVLDGTDVSYRSDQLARRLFWRDGGGLGVLDLRYNATADPVAHSGSFGFLQPPTLYGRTYPSPAFVSGAGYRMLGVEAAAELHRFEDTGCARPR